MSMESAKVFWGTADTGLVAKVMRAGSPDMAQRLAEEAGHGVSAEDLAKTSPKMLFLSDMQNLSAQDCGSQSSPSQSSPSQSSPSQSSPSQSTPNPSLGQDRCSGTGCERGLTFNYRPLL